MVNNLSAGGSLLSATFGALADPTRRAILARLAHGEATVGELAAPFDVSLPAVSKHLRVLECAGLLRREIDGRVHRCRLAAEPMKDAAEWIDAYRSFWEAQFDALAKYLESTDLHRNPSGSELGVPSTTNEMMILKSIEKEKPKWPRHKAVRTSRSKSAAHSPRRGKGSSRPLPNPNN